MPYHEPHIPGREHGEEQKEEKECGMGGLFDQLMYSNFKHNGHTMKAYRTRRCLPKKVVDMIVILRTNEGRSSAVKDYMNHSFLCFPTRLSFDYKAVPLSSPSRS